MNGPHRRRFRGSRTAGFSLLEAVISTILVGTLLIAATRAIGSSVLSRRIMADRAKAACLADALIGEIHQQSYMEPGLVESSIGLESGESSASRSNWDDVDDYHGLAESPLQYKVGSAIAGLVGWQRTAAVEWVALNDTAAHRASRPE